MHHTFTRDPPVASCEFALCLDADMLRAAEPPPRDVRGLFVCRPTAFVGRAAYLLVQLDPEPEQIRVEEFGPMRGSFRQ